MFVVPMPLVEVIESMPAIVLNCCSNGVATEDAIVSGLAPGSDAETWIVGKSTFGRSETGSERNAKSPNPKIPAMTSVVMTGRRMKVSVKLTSSLRLQDEVFRRKPHLHSRFRQWRRLKSPP